MEFVGESSSDLSSQEDNRQKAEDVRLNKMSAYVMDFLEKKIINGHYLPASRIDPKEISKQLDMSPMPVRDALERLVERGWVTKYPQRGTYVRKVSYDDLKEVCQMRMMVECESIRALITNWDLKYLNKLRDIVQKNEQAILDNNLREYEKYDTMFHKQIVASSRNNRIIKISQNVFRQTHYYYLVLIWKSAAVRNNEIMNLRHIPVSHKTIFEAIASKDIPAATELIRSHLNNGLQRYRQIAKLNEMIADLEKQ